MMTEKDKMPPYMNIGSNRIYDSALWSAVCDDTRVAWIRSLGVHKKIIKDMLREITKNSHVLQIGLTFGDEIEAVYEKVQKNGKFDIFDISEKQIALAKARYGNHKIEIMNYNAALPWDEKYDVIICYNLLHELPLQTRRAVMDNVLNGLTNGGKAIFVDTSKPEAWHPLKWPLFVLNRLYRPFTESMWKQPLENFCSAKEEFRWHHNYYGWRLYQRTTAVRKILSSEDVVKLTKLFNGK